MANHEFNGIFLTSYLNFFKSLCVRSVLPFSLMIFILALRTAEDFLGRGIGSNNRCFRDGDVNLGNVIINGLVNEIFNYYCIR